MQVSIASHNNIKASIRHLEMQVGQIEKQLANQQKDTFSANTQMNLKQHLGQLLMIKSLLLQSRNVKYKVQKKKSRRRKVTRLLNKIYPRKKMILVQSYFMYSLVIWKLEMHSILLQKTHPVTIFYHNRRTNLGNIFSLGTFFFKNLNNL